MKIAAYNIMSGGFNTYTHKGNKPDRLSFLRKAIKKIDADFIGLVDTFRWKEIYAQKDLKELFNYKYAFHINMDDVRVDKKIGVAVLSNIKVLGFENLRLKTRNCIKARIYFGSKPVYIYTVYLDDLSEDARLVQIKSFLKNLDTYPTIITGDLNAISEEEAPKLKSDFLYFLKKNPSFKKRKDFKTYFQKVVSELSRGEVVSLLKSKGFIDVQGKKLYQPTAYTKLRGNDIPVSFARVDHIFYLGNIRPKNFKVLKGGIFEKASDHYPIVAEIF